MLIQSAFANTFSSTSAHSVFTSIAPLLLIIAIFYILVIRPQQKKLKDHYDMVKNLKKGDRIITAGGIVGIVFKTELEEQISVIEISKDVKVQIKSATISEVIPLNYNKKE